MNSLVPTSLHLSWLFRGQDPLRLSSWKAQFTQSWCMTFHCASDSRSTHVSLSCVFVCILCLMYCDRSSHLELGHIHQASRIYFLCFPGCKLLILREHLVFILSYTHDELLSEKTLIKLTWRSLIPLGVFNKFHLKLETWSAVWSLINYFVTHWNLCMVHF